MISHLRPNVAFSGAPLLARPLQGLVGRRRASRFPMTWTLTCGLGRHVHSPQRHGTKSAKAFLAVALGRNFDVCNRHCFPDLYCLGFCDDGWSVSRGQKVDVQIDSYGDATCGQRGRDRPTSGMISEAGDYAPMEESAELQQVRPPVHREMDAPRFGEEHASADGTGVTGPRRHHLYQLRSGHRFRHLPLLMAT